MVCSVSVQSPPVHSLAPSHAGTATTFSSSRTVECLQFLLVRENRPFLILPPPPCCLTSPQELCLSPQHEQGSDTVAWNSLRLIWGFYSNTIVVFSLRAPTCRATLTAGLWHWRITQGFVLEGSPSSTPLPWQGRLPLSQAAPNPVLGALPGIQGQSQAV